MSKRVSKAASLELTFLAALDSVHADVDTSEIAEIQDWSRAVRGKFYGASVEKPSRFSKLKARLSALKHPKTVDALGPSSGGFSGAVPAASGNVASHGGVQYSQMAIPQLVAECTSESSEHAWIEFVRRTQPLIANVITKALVRQFGNSSHQLVDDLIQDVYLKLWKDKFRVLRNVEILRENSIFGFLKILAAHTIQDHFRSKYGSRKGGAYEFEAPEATIPGAFAAPERKILLKEIDKVLNTISHGPNFARDRAIFWLYYNQGFSAKEIAALPDIKLSPKGVESTLLRLTRHIRSNVATSDGAQRKKNPN